MRAIISTTIQMYQEYFGASGYMALFLMALLYLLKTKQDKNGKQNHFFIGYTILFVGIYFCPLTAKIIMDYCIGESVYWRMFWMLPYEIVIAYVLCMWITDARKWKKAVLVAVSLGMIAVAGQRVYQGTVFVPRTNIYKIDAEAVAACEAITTDAAANGRSKTAIVSNDLLEEIRQYDASILMPYGRNALRNSEMNTKARKIYSTMSETTLDVKRLAFYADSYGYEYFIYETGKQVENLEQAGYVKVAEAGSHTVYRLDESYEGYWLVTQYGEVDGSQQMFYTLQSQDGYLIVVDGGKADNEEGLRTVLKSLGNHVDTWIITHPHDDHAESFCNVYENPDGIKIDEVYTVDMASPELCMENAPWDSVEVYERFRNLKIENLKYVAEGEHLEFESLQMDVYNAYNEHVDEISNDLLNDGSMMFKIQNKEQSMLFCADVGKAMSDYLLGTYGLALKADYLQMGHHGNGGLKKDFYQMVAPEIAFFDAPNWLFEDTSGTFTSLENRKIMEETGAAIYSFQTTPNSIILK